MKQIFLRLCAVFVFVSGLFLASVSVQAMTPTLSVSATGSGDSVAMTVYGDSNANVALYYQNNQNYSYGTQSQFISTTNSNGYLSTTVSSATYGITAGSSVYVVVNNQTSTSVAWPFNYNNNYGNSYGYGSLTLSQSNISVTVGQSTNVTIYGGSTPYTMYSNGSNVIQAVISGNTLQITGLNIGSGSLNVCSAGGMLGGQCASLYVTVFYVSVYNNQSVLAQHAPTFSQNNPTLSVGQSLAISISGLTPYYGGSYYVAYNSNSSGLSAIISGSTLTLQGMVNSNVSVVVCSVSTNCSALNVVVGGIGYVNSGWAQCANEGQFCSFSGIGTVRYGANGIYVYRTTTNDLTCSNAVFGDPIFGVAKSCSFRLGQ